MINDSPVSIRVANLIEESRWGGPQKRIVLVASDLIRHGIETTVLLPERDSEKFCSELASASVKWKTLPLHSLKRGWKSIFFYVFYFPFEIISLWRELRIGHYDLLHVSGGAWQIKGPIAARLAGVPAIWHLNDTRMPAIVLFLFRALGFLASGFFVAATRVMDTYLRGTRLERIPCFTVPAPVETSKYRRDCHASEQRISDGKFPRIISVANVNPVKGIEVLVEAAANLKRNLNEFSVFVVGSIHASQQLYFATLEELIKRHGLEDNFFFLGATQNVPSVLRGADIFVCSSVAEASPMSVWEAMSMGCAIVSTDVGDVASHVKHGTNGFIVPVGNAQALADAVLDLAKNEPLRILFGENARAAVCRELDLSVVSEKTAIGYRSVLGR